MSCYNNSLKCVLIGEPSSGKKSLLDKLEEYTYTKETSNYFSEHIYRMKFNTSFGNVYMDILLTNNMYFTNSEFQKPDGVFMVYDVSNEYSFNIVKHYINHTIDNNFTSPIVIIANKIDLLNNDTQLQHLCNILYIRQNYINTEIFNTTTKLHCPIIPPFLEMLKMIYCDSIYITNNSLDMSDVACVLDEL